MTRLLVAHFCKYTLSVRYTKSIMNEKAHKQEETLSEEIHSYQDEKERIRSIIDTIGGSKKRLYNRIINTVFILTILVLFVLEFFTDILDKIVAMEIGILLVSLKILWMMYEQSRVEDFMFWILSSIKFQVNSIDKKINDFNKQKKDKPS